MPSYASTTLGKGCERLEKTENKKDKVDSTESFLKIKQCYAKAGMGLVSVKGLQQHE